MTFHKTFMGAKPLHIRFEKVDGFIKIYNETRYLVLFGPERHNAIYDRIRYLISDKSGITYCINHNLTKIRIDSYNSLPIEKTLSQVLLRIKNPTNIVLGKDIWMRINPIQNFFKMNVCIV